MTSPTPAIEPLTSAELLAAAGHALSLSAGGIQHATLEQLKNEIAGVAKGASLVDDDGRRVVMSVLRGTTKLVLPAAIERMASERVYFVRSNICNAVSVRLRGRTPVVVVFSGLLKALQYFMEIRGCISVISAAIDRDVDVGLSRNDLSVAGFQAMMGLCYFVAEERPLLRPGAGLSAAAKHNLTFTFSQTLWFLLMHETGHIQLGHFGHRRGRAYTPPSLVLNEGLNRHKKQEFEADRFYLESINAEQRLYALNYILDTLTIFSFIENHLGADQASHPLAINRLQHIVDLYGNPEDTYFLERVRTIIETEVQARKSAAALRRQSQARGRRGLNAFVSYEETQEAARRLRSALEAAQGGGAPEARSITARLWDHMLERWWDPSAPPPSPWTDLSPSRPARSVPI